MRWLPGAFAVITTLLAPPPTLASNDRVTLSALEEHRLVVPVTAGERWLVVVEQFGIDVVLERIAPSKTTVDTPLGREGREILVIDAETTGDHVLVVRSQQEGAPTGEVSIRVERMTDEARAEAWSTHGDAITVGADPAWRVTQLQRVIEIWTRLDEPDQTARAWLVLGAGYESQDQPRLAADAFEHAIELATLPTIRARALDRLGRAYRYLGDTDKAITHLQRAVGLRHELGDREREAETRNYLCLIWQRTGRWTEAEHCFLALLDDAHELEDRELEARVRNNLGGIHQNLGEPAKALAYFEQALAIRRAIGEELGAATTLNNRGALYRGLGDVDEALADYDRALALFERLDNRYWQARTLNNIGFAYLYLGDHERARAYLERALPVRREVGDRLGEATTLRNLGRVALALGETDDALDLFRQALDSSLDRNDRRGEATARKLIATALIQTDRTSDAAEEIEQALAILRALGKRQEEAEVLELSSRVALASVSFNQAASLTREALALHRQVRDPIGEVTALTTLARIERARGNDDAITTALDAALARIDELEGQIGDLARRAAFTDARRKARGLYIEHLMSRHRDASNAGHDRKALEIRERARARALLALLTASDRGALPPRDRARLRAAERYVTAKTQRVRRIRDASDLPEAEAELFDALAKLDAVRVELRRSHPRWAALRAPTIIDVDGMSQLLDARTVMLDYYLGKNESYLWWMSHDAIASFVLPARAAIEPLAIDLHAMLSQPGGNPAEKREALDRLGRILLGPVVDRLDGRRLVVATDGVLHLLPFDALTSPVDNRPLIATHEVISIPSASALARLRDRVAGDPDARDPDARDPDEPEVAIFADPIFDADDPRLVEPARGPTKEPLGRLHHSHDEARAIAALLPAERRLLATSSAARRARVLAGELDDFDIVHFATHGVVNTRIPQLSGLILARYDQNGIALDDFLSIRDVTGLELGADLVVLSGCHTATGRQVWGEGMISLARAFMASGVPTVVASSWQVRDQATAELMAHVYRGLLVEHLPPSTALRAARLALREKRRYRDPYFWAGFSVYGDWR
ncbi:MAG: CHAT domain-containing protein [Acidobacteriota bacterium]